MPRLYLSPPHVGSIERELLLEAFDSNWIAPLGPAVDAFEREMAGWVGVSHAAALSSGTAGLHLSLLLLGVGRGDIVLTSSLTFAATANAIRYCGAEPVFVDVEAAAWTLDPTRVDDALATLREEGSPAKAVIAVDLYGQVCDYAALKESCARHQVPLIEDAAEALGSARDGRNAGAFAELAVLSFNGNKIITTAGGGMLLSEDREHIRRARYLATQARDPAPHYEHSAIGYNYRLSNLLAAVGRGQLRALPERVAARRAHREAYLAALGDLPGWRFLTDPPGAFTNAWLTCVTIDPEVFGADREAVRSHLEGIDVESRPVWKPMHLQPVFRGCRTFGGEVAARLFRDGLCLPSGSAMTDEDRTRVIERVKTVR